MVLLALATGIAVASFLFIRSFVPFLLVMCLYATAQCGLAAARQALLAGLVDRAARTGVLAHLQSTLNAGPALGAALGGLALQYDTQEAYLAVFALDAVGFLICTTVLLLLPAVGHRHPGRAALRPDHARLVSGVRLVGRGHGAVGSRCGARRRRGAPAHR
ncbi:MFS transporter [Streptomyces platensis]|uniref:MFS transporter n=1 Tax=Streptomyces platensis TaxID=58346 RepID=UPI002E1213DC|nr:MFS transporter [Streptomyces platensis]